MLKRISKLLYRKLPITLEHKLRLKEIAFQYFGFACKSFDTYNMWKAYQNYTPVPDSKISKSISFSKQNIQVNNVGKIAIQLHLYYIDLLDYFVNKISYMPFEYDLFISVPKEEYINTVRAAAAKFMNLNQMFVELVPNQGRDVAPFVVQFSSRLLNYQYFCHIHSKKSLYLGADQIRWREYLVNNLLGSGWRIQKIFYLFESYPSLGIIYPETIQDIPYWGHTWLMNKKSGARLLSRLGVVIASQKYIDFPVGTMFWARTSALKPLLETKLSYSDFSEELGQIDGTLAHAIERSLALISRSQGSDFAVVDFDKKIYSLNCGEKNLWQYWYKSKQELLSYLKAFDIISFDIFDTLITRVVLDPDIVFLLMQRQVQTLFDIREFLVKRKMAEDNLRIKDELKNDCNIHDIYIEFAKLTACSQSTAEQIKQLEISYELSLTYPRDVMVEIFNALKQMDKKIILVSDMYLTSEIMQQLLEKNNIIGYDKLYISCEVGKRKDSGEMWQYLNEVYADTKFVHVGDNEVSDVKLASDNKFSYYHVMAGNTLLEFSPLFSLINSNCRQQIGNNVIMGLLVAKKFNDPFALNPDSGKFTIKDPLQFGYTFIAPVILYFMQWLIQALQRDKVSNVLFLAREGYLLTKVYDLIQTYTEQNIPEACYFLTSRRASSFASLKQSEDVDDVIRKHYEGDLYGLALNRFGLVLENTSNQQINLPNDFNKVQAKLRQYYPQILQQAKEEREAYLQYINKQNLQINQDIAVVDLGYSGSIQYYLSKILDTRLRGYYFAINDEFIATKYDGSEMHGCFDSGVKSINTQEPIFRYYLILEAILTAPTGQLINFTSTSSSEVVANYKETDDTAFEAISKVQEGVIEFFQLGLSKFGSQLLEFEYDKSFISKLFELAIISPDILDENIKNVFRVEDGYCSNSNLTIFELYKQVGML